ncbi:MAG: endolytic transglycosylase MltG [Anaerovoracaceae bacterium]
MSRRNNKSKKKLTKKTRILLILVAVFLVIALAAVLVLNALSAPADRDNLKSKAIAIEMGTGSSVIADTLEKEGIIKSATMFKIFLRINLATNNLKSGYYALSPSMDAKELLKKLESGRDDGVIVTIQEGSRVYEIAQILDKAGIVKEKAFIKEVKKGNFDYKFMKYLPKQSEMPKGFYRLEGVLFPDTYSLIPGSKAHDVVNEMLYSFDKAFNEKHWAELEASGKSFMEMLTIASMVQEEAVYAKDQKLVAGVFYNRLDKNMPMGSTVTYLFGVGQRGREITNAEAASGNAYNTNNKVGLPPGPIGNPGITAINAALKPEKTDYLYFVVKKAGTFDLVYSKTFEEHQKAVNAYEKSFKNQKEYEDSFE